ncbi:hypothetical protein RI367_007637 [Sorochytrium milnesiophthora]
MSANRPPRPPAHRRTVSDHPYVSLATAEEPQNARTQPSSSSHPPQLPMSSFVSPQMPPMAQPRGHTRQARSVSYLQHQQHHVLPVDHRDSLDLKRMMMRQPDQSLVSPLVDQPTSPAPAAAVLRTDAVLPPSPLSHSLAASQSRQPSVRSLSSSRHQQTPSISRPPTVSCLVEEPSSLYPPTVMKAATSSDASISAMAAAATTAGQRQATQPGDHHDEIFTEHPLPLGMDQPPSTSSLASDAPLTSAPRPQSRWALMAGAFALLVKYTHTGTVKNKRNRRSFLIGLATVFLIVMFLSLVQNALVRSPIVFVKISENLVGQFDLLMIPSPSTVSSLAAATAPNAAPPSSTSALSLLNFTAINQTLSTVATVQGAAPRWLLPANVTKRASTAAQIQADIRASLSSSPQGNATLSAAYLLIIDTDQELSAGIATAWPHRTLGEGEAHVTGSLLRALKCRPNAGDVIVIQFDLLQMLNNAGVNAAQNSSSSSTNGTVAQRITTNNGRIAVTMTPPEYRAALLLSGGNQSALANHTSQDGNGNYVVDGQTLGQAYGLGDLYTFKQEFTVIDDIEATYAKYPQNIGNVIVLDAPATQLLLQRKLLQSMSNPLYPQLAQTLGLPTTPEQVINWRINDYSMSVVLSMANRLASYTKSTNDRQKDIVRFSNDVVLALGISYPADYSDVLNQALQSSQFIQIFMNEIFFTVIAILALLAALLIYSLLISDVEEKTFEYGMLRSLGMKQDSVIGLLIIQSLYFSVPGIILGLGVSILLYMPIEGALSSYANVPYNLQFSTSAWLLGLLLGLLLPVVGMVVPIRRALSKTLRDALDIYHNSTFDTVVTIQKLENIGINLNETIFALLLVGIGFLVYYVVPLAFTFNNLPLFFRVLTVILLGMVVGQTLLAQILQHALEFIALKLCVWGPDRKLSDVVAKNLGGHIQRNRKTALMFTLCLAYIIFAAAMFTLQTDSLSQTLEWSYGADLVVNGRGFLYPLPEQQLRDYFSTVMYNASNAAAMTTSSVNIVEGYTFTTYPLNSYYPVNSLHLGAVVTISRPSVKLYGIEDNFLDVALQEYYMPSSIDAASLGSAKTASDQPNVIPQLDDYVNPMGSAQVHIPAPITVTSSGQPSDNFNPNVTQLYTQAIPLLISNSLQSSAYLTTDTLCPLSLEYTPVGAVWSTTKLYLTKPIAILTKLPAFPSISRLVTSNTPIVTSMRFYQYLLSQVDTYAASNVVQATGTALPKGTLLVRVAPNVDPLQIEALINGINTVIRDDKVPVQNLRLQLSTAQSAASLITVLFNIVALVGVLLSFFVLWLSFTANIKENAWEFGVLRAIGLDRKRAGSVDQLDSQSMAVTRVYIYEALCLILATIILGTIIGIMTAITLTLQFNLFTEMPFTFRFPVPLFSSVVAMSLVVAVIGSFLPANEIRKKQIALALKGL